MCFAVELVFWRQRFNQKSVSNVSEKSYYLYPSLCYTGNQSITVSIKLIHSVKAYDSAFCQLIKTHTFYVASFNKKDSIHLLLSVKNAQCFPYKHGWNTQFTWNWSIYFIFFIFSIYVGSFVCRQKTEVYVWTNVLRNRV